MNIRAWVMDDDETADQRLPRQRTPNQEVPMEKLGVLNWSGLSGPED